MPRHRRHVLYPFPKEIRENVIRTIELLASEAMQLDYETNVPIADVPAELLESWSIFNPNELRLKVHFSDQEWAGLVAVDRAMEWFLPVARKHKFCTVNELLNQPKWLRVVSAAQSALAEFA